MCVFARNQFPKRRSVDPIYPCPPPLLELPHLTTDVLSFSPSPLLLILVIQKSLTRSRLSIVLALVWVLASVWSLALALALDITFTRV